MIMDWDKLLSGRWLLTIAASIVFVRLGFALVKLLTPEMSKDVMMFIGQIITMIVICYFNKPPDKPMETK
jgi:hypothetical protein